MAVQQQSLPSFASIISVLSIVFYCVGFIRVELELKEQGKRINALESITEPTKPPSNDPDIKLFIKNAPEIQSNHKLQRNRRQIDTTKNSTEAKSSAEKIIKISKLLSELCHACSSGPPGPPGPPGPKGARGLRGQKGRTGNKGDKGLMGSPGRSGKQGIMGAKGLQGEPGTKGMKGEVGPTGMPGTKGEPGESIHIDAQDCSDLLKSGHTQSGEYSVNPDGKGHFTVYCDMRTDGGGWTVFQRRQDGSVDFYRGWSDYKAGFGQLTAEFWLGNDKIHRLTASRPSSLRVEMEDWNGVKVYAKYGKFNIGDEQAKYRLEVGSYSGTAGDSLAADHSLNNMPFTTKDRDNDRSPGENCAVSWTGAWWYKSCHHSNLNGKYLGEKHDSRGLKWNLFRSRLSLKFTEMKLRPSS